MNVLSGPEVASARKSQLTQRIDAFKSKTGRKPGLTVVIVGQDPASHVYVKNKVKKASELGIESQHIELPESTTESDLIAQVRKLNGDEKVDAILVQLPLPRHIDTDSVVEAILPQKDPDGLTSGNLGLLFAGKTRIAPCTPLGVMKILEHYKISVAGKNAVVIGRSNIVGKPMAQLLLEANATVTICHSKTKNLHEFTKKADIVVVAAGQPRLLGMDAFAENAVVIDVGIHRLTEGPRAGKLCGDVKFEELTVRAATPVPGGVGPMTIQMLMENTVTLAEKRAQ